MEQFQALPMGDIWEDADLLGPLRYLMDSSRCRRMGSCLLDGSNRSDHILYFKFGGAPSRIPEDWKLTMETFFKDYEQQAGLNIRYCVPHFISNIPNSIR